MSQKRIMLVLLGLALSVLLVAAPLAAQDSSYTVGLGSTDALGSFLVGPDGMTLYLFTRDTVGGDSVCYDRCADRWPPLLVDSADMITVDPAIPGTVGTVARTDGTLQVTYNGWPLYYWYNDKAPGDTDGEAVGKTWWVIPPATVYSAPTPDLGTVLVGANGMTVYMFDKDTDGTSACYDQCATNWPPLLVDSADAIVPGLFLQGDLGTTERTDGTLQVTYNGMPLYYYAKDMAIGDTVGEAVGDVWWTVTPPTVAVSTSADFGDYLTDVSGLTLYTFANDSEGVSNCTGDCLANWPAFTVGANDRVVAPAAAMGTLDTLTRDDGSRQVTYNGMPLYYYADDKAAGDANGQGAGGVWYVVSP